MKTKLKQKWKESPLGLIFACIAILSVIGIAVSILLYTRFAYNSDFSYATNLALEELDQIKLYPDGWMYSTGFYVFSINLFSMPFLLFLKNEVLCRELAVILLGALMIFACYKAFYQQSKKMFWTVIGLTFLPVLGVMHWYFYDGNYFNFAVMQMLTLVLAGNVLYGAKTKHAWIYDALYVVALIIFTNDGLRNQLTITIPLFLAVFFMYYRKQDKKLFEKKQWKFLILTMAGAVAGFLIYHLLLWKLGWQQRDTVDYQFVNPVQVIGNLWTFLANTYAIYGVSEGSLLSVKGITNALNAIYGTLAMFVIPVIVLKNLAKIKSEFIRLVMVFCGFCNVLTIFMVIMTTSNGSRLLLPVYFNNILFIACFTGFLADIVWKRYTEILVLMLIVLICANQLNFQVQQRQQGRLTATNVKQVLNPQDETGLVSFLKEHDLTYGYAPYFHAFRTASFSEGEIRIVSFEGADPMSESGWMTSTRWYDVEEHPGRCFVLIPADMTIDETYYDLADEVLDYTATYTGSETAFLVGEVPYKILVFDKNIHLYPELVGEE